MKRKVPLHRGRCLCGEARFTARGAPLWVGFCHCASCRRATGGALIAACGFLREAVVLKGETLQAFASSPGVVRRFCGRCGSSLSYENELWPTDIHLMLGTFDRPERLSPQFHIFSRERLPWLLLGDLLPRYPTTPSAGLDDEMLF